MKERGIPPSEVRTDGTDRYTVPAIFDPSTNTTISDSTRILRYLDEAYPDTPKLCSPDDPTDEFIKPAFEPGWNILGPKMYSTWALLVPTIVAHLDGESALKYEKNFQNAFKTTVEEFLANKEKQEECWKQTVEAFEGVESWFAEAEARYGKGNWITGKGPKLPDLVLATAVNWTVLFGGEDNELWKKIAQLNNGRWAAMWQRIKPYATLH